MSEIRSQATPAKDELAGERDALAMWLAGYGIPDAIAEDAATAFLNDYQRKPRTVNSATELDALPMFTVIRSEQGSAWERQYGALGKPLWIEATQTRGFPHTSDEIALPATVLFTPGGAG